MIRKCLIAAVCMVSPLSGYTQSFQRVGPSFISFQVPDSAGTFPSGVNDALSVTGYYMDANQQSHGFVRYASGQIISFDVLGSVTTDPVGIDAAGEVAGNYQEERGFSSGFVRSPGGEISEFNPAGSGGSTVVTGINATGSITGYYTNTNTIPPAYGFVRRRDGSMITFTIGGSTVVIPENINAAGEITGYYYSDDNTSVGGFIRSPNGDIATFDFDAGIVPESISAAGFITGWYAATEFHGFVRSAEGVITSFDPPGTLLTQYLSINGAGAIAGSYQVQQSLSSTFNSHGFLRSPEGKIVSFDPPGGTQTTATGIEDRGVITGWYYGSTAPNASGFLRMPHVDYDRVDPPTKPPL